MPTVLMVIAPETFRDEEYSHPKKVLERRGASVVTASTHAGTCHGKLGMEATAEVSLSEVEAQDYDALVFVGGAGARVFFDDPTAHRLALAMSAIGRPVAAICIAPSVLAHAGLLAGRQVTSFPSQAQDLVDHAANYTGEMLEIDGNILTANGPDAACAFGEAIADALGLPDD